MERQRQLKRMDLSNKRERERGEVGRMRGDKNGKNA